MVCLVVLYINLQIYGFFRKIVQNFFFFFLKIVKAQLSLVDRLTRKSYS